MNRAPQDAYVEGLGQGFEAGWNAAMRHVVKHLARAFWWYATLCERYGPIDPMGVWADQRKQTIEIVLARLNMSGGLRHG